MEDQQNIQAPELSPSDAVEEARWAEMQAEYADDGGDAPTPELNNEPPRQEAQAQEPPEGEPEQEQEQEQEQDDQQRLPYEEVEKRHKQLQGALNEERALRRQQAERLQRMETVFRELVEKQQQGGQQQASQQAPDPNEDPLGYLEHQNRQLMAEIDAIKQQTQQTVQQQQQSAFEQQLEREIQRSANAFAAQTPDYNDAVQFLENARLSEIATMYPAESPQVQAWAEQQGFRDVGELHEAILHNERQQVAQQAIQFGMSPAERYYQFAKGRGWTGQAPQRQQAAPQQRQAINPIEAARQGQRASRSLNNGASQSNSTTVDDLAAMYLNDPEAADKMFERMRDQGLLG